MIIQFSIENFKSIHDKAVFSMLASNDNTHMDYLRRVNQLEILPTTIIVGANGAGKSNLFQSIKYLQELLLNKHEQIPFFPHKLHENDQGTNIDIQFILNEAQYAYGITINNHKVEHEYLYKAEDEEQIILIERENTQITYRDDDYLDFIDESLVALSYIQKEYDNDLIRKVYEFLTDKILIILTEHNDEKQLFERACEQFNHEKNQKIVSSLIKRLDIGIKEFYIQDDEIMVRYENMEINLLEESTGNKKLFMLLTLISDVINEGRIILFDELEKNLHLMLVTYLIKMFNSKKTNKQNAQLIFSTHNTSLLNLSLFRRDQVWLMEKNFKTLNTELYSLYNILDVLHNENIEYGYIAGKYGATFKINFDEVVGYDE